MKFSIGNIVKIKDTLPPDTLCNGYSVGDSINYYSRNGHGEMARIDRVKYRTNTQLEGLTVKIIHSTEYTGGEDKQYSLLELVDHGDVCTFYMPNCWLEEIVISIDTKSALAKRFKYEL